MVYMVGVCYMHMHYLDETCSVSCCISVLLSRLPLSAHHIISMYFRIGISSNGRLLLESLMGSVLDIALMIYFSQTQGHKNGGKSKQEFLILRFLIKDHVPICFIF